MKKILFLILIGACAILFMRFPYAIKSQNDLLSLAFTVTLLSVFILKADKLSSSVLLQNITIWIVIVGVILLGYSFRDDLKNNRIITSLFPRLPVELKPGSLQLTKADNGHFHVETTMDDVRVSCMIDTGATSIIIDQKDAQSMGIDLQSLNFNIPTSTANGIGMNARTTIKQLSVGSIMIPKVTIYINKEPMGDCLLGMAFLNRMKSFTVSGDKLTIEY
jgi:aspartyl protease family protein